jgi:hypothetical protein
LLFNKAHWDLISLYDSVIPARNAEIQFSYKIQENILEIYQTKKKAKEAPAIVYFQYWRF